MKYANDLDALLEDRGKEHGPFHLHARITQELKHAAQDTWAEYDHVKREALDMILHKIGRILAGNKDNPDHWQDIAGYATLVSRELELGVECGEERA